MLQGQGERALGGETVRWAGLLTRDAGADPRFVQRPCIPFRETGRRIDGCFLILRDLTERRQAERRLAEQVAEVELCRGLNAAITASAPDCVVVIDEDGCVVEFNPAAERTFGHFRADVLGRPIADIIVPPHLRARHAQGFARYMATGEAHVLGRRMEIEGQRADGTIVPPELAITEVRLPDRRLFTACLRDLTAAHAAQADIRRSRDAPHQGEKMAAFALAPLVRAAVEMLAHGLRAGGIDVTNEIPDDLPPAKGDADQLHQGLVNLLSNARQAPLAQPSPRRPAFVTGDTLGQATASFPFASGRPHLEKSFLREEIRRVVGRRVDGR